MLLCCKEDIPPSNNNNNNSMLLDLISLSMSLNNIPEFSIEPSLATMYDCSMNVYISRNAVLIHEYLNIDQTL